MALLVGACSGGEQLDLTDGNAAAAAANGRTEAGKTARFSLNYDAELAGPLKVSGSGVFDFDAVKGTLDAKLNDQAVKAVLDASTIYLNVGGLLGGGSKPWISYDLDRGGPLFGGMDQLLRLADPRDSLTRLPLASDMKRVGEDKVRAVKTVHFRGVIDVSDAGLAKLPPDDADEVREIRDAYGLSTYPLDLWLDNQGRVRRLVTGFEGKSGDRPVKAKTTLELFNYGDKVKVTVPAADQIQNLNPAA